MNIPLLEGRLCNVDNSSVHPAEAVVNQAFVRKYFGDRDPIGRRVTTSRPSDPPNTVVGVVANVRHSSLEEEPPPEIYTAWQNDAQHAYIVVRSALPPQEIASAVRATLRTIDPNLALADIHTMGELISKTRARRRFQTTLVTVFAGSALLLALIGLYGLVSYSVKQRTAEIGVRMALGASRKQVITMILGSSMKLVIAGLVVGLAGALALTRILSSFLYNVRPIDPLTFVAVPALLLLVTIAACAIPGWRAAEVDPIQALRCD